MKSVVCLLVVLFTLLAFYGCSDSKSSSTSVVVVSNSKIQLAMAASRDGEVSFSSGFKQIPKDFFDVSSEGNGAFSTRYIVIKNDNEYPVRVEQTKWARHSSFENLHGELEQVFFLKPGEKRQIEKHVIQTTSFCIYDSTGALVGQKRIG